MIESTARAERVNLQSFNSPAYSWEPPEKPVSVRMPFTLIDRMEREVVENFRSLTSRGSEIGGILLGAAAPGNPAVVSIEDYEVIPCDYSRGPLYRLSDADMGRFERSIEQRSAASGLGVVGFFRSHTRKGLCLDPEDLSFITARFRDPLNVALLVRPFATKASTAGFFIWESGAVQGEASYLEFPFRSSQLSPSRQNGPVVEPAPAVNPAVSPAAAAPPPSPASPKPIVRAQIVPIASRRELTLPVPPEPAESPVIEQRPSDPKAAPKPPEAKAAEPKQAEPKAEPKIPVAASSPAPAREKEADKPKEKEVAKAKAAEPVKEPDIDLDDENDIVGTKSSSGRKGLIAGIGAVAALAACTILFLYPGVLRHTGPGASTAGLDAPSLSLRVERTGTDILLTWNRDSAAIQHAAHAVLTISDGERHENYDMDLGQLRNGSIVYSPLTADVSFKMDVTSQSSAKIASESVRVLRTRPSPMPDGSQPPETAAKTTTSKPGAPVNAGAPAGQQSATEPSPVAEEKPASVKPSTPTKAFNTESLAQRLRPATPAEVSLPDAPVVNNSPVLNASAPSFGASQLAPAPVAPAPPAPAAPERRASQPPSGVPGGQIQQAQVVFSKQPEYPKLARQMGVKGSVEVLATIGVDGHVKSVRVEKGHPLLVKAATDAVMQWIYKPTLLNGVPVQNDTHITLNFMGDK
jgi:TonB family protein